MCMSLIEIHLLLHYEYEFVTWSRVKFKTRRYSKNVDRTGQGSSLIELCASQLELLRAKGASFYCGVPFSRLFL